VTEIPEHLLKRSKERRAAIGGEAAPGDEAPAAAAPATTEAADTPAPAPAAAPAVPAEPPAPEPPKPVRPEVAAALSRRRIPYWALPVLLALPLWAYVYQGTLEPPPEPESGVLALGEEVYGQCAACHGASGGGVSGPPLTDVLQTWPDFRDHVAWVAVGSQGWPADSYGANDRPKNGGMPAFASILSEEELAQVVLYERVEFGGLDEGSDEYAALERVAHGESTFADEGLGPESTEAGVDTAAITPAG
jgi:mono/diheme cytochrome c family protein